MDFSVPDPSPNPPPPALSSETLVCELRCMGRGCKGLESGTYPQTCHQRFGPSLVSATDVRSVSRGQAVPERQVPPATTARCTSGRLAPAVERGAWPHSLSLSRRCRYVWHMMLRTPYSTSSSSPCQILKGLSLGREVPSTSASTRNSTSCREPDGLPVHMACSATRYPPPPPAPTNRGSLHIAPAAPVHNVRHFIT